MIKPALIAVIVLSLAGCGSSGPIPTDTFYHLPIAAPAAQSRLTERSILVHEFVAADLYQDRAILYSDGAEFEVKRHRFHFWADSAPEMLYEGLTKYLRDADTAGRIVARSGKADLEIDGRVLAFERFVQGSDVRVKVTLELRLQADAAAEPLLAQSYTEEVAVEGAGIDLSVAAFGTATSRIFARFVTDLAPVLQVR